MRCGSRCIYICSSSPSFVILDDLGGSIENVKRKLSLLQRNNESEDDLTTMRGLYRTAHLNVGVDLKKKKLL